MGKDNLFHKRKARKKEQLARRGKQRDPYAKVLIVCEGKKGSSPVLCINTKYIKHITC